VTLPASQSPDPPAYLSGIIAPWLNVVNLKMEEFAPHGETGPINSHSIGGGNRNRAHGSLLDHSARWTVPQCGSDQRPASPLSCSSPSSKSGPDPSTSVSRADQQES
jgi:hypothetical protein